MSLPTAQTSIRSFFQAKTPKYDPPPPSKTSRSDVVVTPTAATAPPPPPSAVDPGPRLDSTPPPPPPAKGPPPTTTPSNLNLPREAAVRHITSDDITALKRINTLLLPVAYPDSFYKAAADTESDSGFYSRVITWQHDGDSAPQVVGGVVSRLEPKFAGSSDHVLYIRSLCLLAPFRSLGLMGAAVDDVVNAATGDPSRNITATTAHVWTENDEGLKWYDSHGFKRVGQPLQGYYIKLRPDSAWLVRRDISATATVKDNLPSNPPPQPSRPIGPSPTAAVLNLPATSTGPPPASGEIGSGPPRTASSQSFQNLRPDMEWNDLPADMATGRLGQPPKASSESVSAASSRSSSAARKKRDRSYPAAAFGK